MQRNFRHTKDVLKYSAVYKKRRKVKIVKMVFFGVLFLFILIGLIFIVRLSTFTISDIQVKGLQSADTQDVMNEINSNINGSYALVLPKKNIFFYPKDKIKNDLLKKFSTFADVQIKTIDTNKLEVTVVEKNAMAVNCKTEQTIIDKTFSDCFFIDSNARAFQAVTGEPDQSLDKYVDFNVNTASSTLSATTMEQLQKVKINLTSKNLITQFIKIVDLKSAEFQIVDNGKIKISIPVSDDFTSILDTALGTDLLLNSVKFEYIDARFGNKVFFKAKGANDEKGITKNSTSTSSSTSASLVVKSLTTKGATTTMSIKNHASTSASTSVPTTVRAATKNTKSTTTSKTRVKKI